MGYLYNDLLRKKKELEELINMVSETGATDVPEGNLRIDRCNGHAQYYISSGKHDNKERYLRKEERELAYLMAQRGYDDKFLKEAQEELKRVEKFLKKYNPNKLHYVYEKMSTSRKEIVVPYILSDKEYIKHWNALPYEHKPFAEGTPEIYTERGERVRSKSEKILADMMNREGIPYRYEYPIYLKGMGVIHPDFTLLNKRERKEVYLEHLGMMDNPEYCQKALMRLDFYSKNNIVLGDKLFITYETSIHPIDTKAAWNIIQNAVK